MLAQHPQLRSLAVAAAVIVVMAVALVLPTHLHAQSTTPAAPGALLDPAAPRATSDDADPVSQGVYWDTPPHSPTILRLRNHIQIIPGPEDQVRMIVLLDGAPLSTLVTRPKFDEADELSAASVATVDAAAMRQQQAMLAAQQAQFIAGAQAAGVEVQVNRNFVYLLNGVAVSTKAGAVATLRSLPGVTSLYPDYRVQADLLESVPLIGAPLAWQMHDANGFPVTGEGIDVAIIDTGIDYTHPDLGGCFGIGCRVAGGWDFENGDGDPKDDHNHGTHVAGIVAASGAITGVAPAAHLWAFKVLDYGGYGYASTIIAGIERSADLDGDPITVDPADVANISLGGSGSPDDPMSRAVNAAVDAGVVVAVSAGNSGPYDGSLRSPGVAQKAITVAASDKQDQIAGFSSRGPVRGYESMLKPDITAPGVSITSTVRAARYLAYSGTSMAAPHVAGAAALLKQLHPGWSPLRIKSNLMNTAKDLGASIFTQGSGRLQVDKAITAPMIVQPATIDMGYVDSGLPGWQLSQPITIVNRLSIPATYSLTISATLPARIVAELSDSSITVDPGKSRVVRLNLHSALTETISTEVSALDDLIMGAVVVQSAAATIKSYFALSIDGQLTIQFAESVPWVIVHNDLMAVTQEDFYFRSTTLRLPIGHYDVVTLFPGNGVDKPAAMVVRENVAVSRTTAVRLSRSDGTNSIQFVATTENGGPLAATTLVSSLSHSAHRVAVVAQTKFISNTPSSMFSYASQAYRIEAHTSRTVPGNALTVYDGYYRQDGVGGDANLVQDPARLQRKLLQLAPAGMNAARTIARCVRPYWSDTPAAPALCAPFLASSTLPLVAAHYMAPIPNDAAPLLTSYRVLDNGHKWAFDDLFDINGPDMLLAKTGRFNSSPPLVSRPRRYIQRRRTYSRSVQNRRCGPRNLNPRQLPYACMHLD
ncbi:MAG: S8 family serine peptidase [Anaerolineales bacterium]|nr:S8 family serine peptidase [Anaerolineales bacterium]